MPLLGDDTKAQPPSFSSGEGADSINVMACNDAAVEYDGVVEFDPGVGFSSAGIDDDKDADDNVVQLANVAICDDTGSSRMSPVDKKRKSSTNNGTDRKLQSWVWNYCKKTDDPLFSQCLLCPVKINRGANQSTGPLIRHISRAHNSVYRQRLANQAMAIVSGSGSANQSTPISEVSFSGSSSLTLDPFFVDCPKFEDCLLKWVIATYQPLRCVEDPNFRRMCHSLNKKAPIMSREKLKMLLAERYHLTEATLKQILKGRHFAFTTDGWTSLAQVGYVTCTVHFIDAATWKLHSLVMGLYEKHGGSKHEDIVSYCENQLTLFDLPYSNAVAVVTDTEATMVAAGRLFVRNSVAANGNTKWIGCIDHLLQLVTKKAFSGNVIVIVALLFIYI